MSLNPWGRFVILFAESGGCPFHGGWNKSKVKMKAIVWTTVALLGWCATAADEANIAEFREARFGMFIHWGLYSQLGGRWKGETMPYIGEWAQSYFRIPNAEYVQLAKDFNPTQFDPDDWARQGGA